MEFVEPEASGAAEESGDEAVTDDETDLGTDWETVPSPRFCDIPSQVPRTFRSLPPAFVFATTEENAQNDALAPPVH